MSSRMEKYDSLNGKKSRTFKNEKLYDKVGDININYDYIDVNNAVEFEPKNDYRTSREDYQKKMELDKILSGNKKEIKSLDEVVTPKENRVYDINEILKNAKEENPNSLESKSKRLINTEYNILTKLDIKNLDKENYRKEDLKSLIDDIYEKEAPKKVKSFRKRNENELLSDLFEDNNDDASDLSEEIKLKEELSKNILDNNEDEGTVPITEEIKDLKDEVENEKPNNDPIPQAYKKSPDENEMFIFDSLSDEINTKKDKKKNNKNKKDQEAELNSIIKEEASKSDGIDYDEIDKDGKGLLIAIIVVAILIILTVLFFVYEYFFG